MGRAACALTQADNFAALWVAIRLGAFLVRYIHDSSTAGANSLVPSNLLLTPWGLLVGCHCWLAQQCVLEKHCWASQQWHPM